MAGAHKLLMSASLWVAAMLLVFTGAAAAPDPAPPRADGSGNMIPTPADPVTQKPAANPVQPPRLQTAPPQAPVAPSGVCSSDLGAAKKTFVSGAALPAAPAQTRLMSPWPYLPTRGIVQLYLFAKYGSDQAMTYRIFVAKSPFDKTDNDAILQVALNDEVSAQDASRTPAPTDELKKTSPEKTLIQYESAPSGTDEWNFGRRNVRVTVVGCAASDKPPAVYGVFDAQISSVFWCRTSAILMCVVIYLFAAAAAFYVRRRNRSAETPAGYRDFWRFGKEHKQAMQDLQGRSMTGTNYASFWAHLDPVILTAGPNGKGNPTKLQILFFSIVVFGVMSYIYMLTGHLIGLSTNILLLLGISGVGAVAAGGTETAKNRLSFENFAWLIINKWLPKGGIAEENRAEWKDIFTSDGEFDVSRFQMVAFSFMVATSLIGYAARVNDLADFDISNALLGLLGLSQVLYVSGKLIAPPAISDFDGKLNDLRKAETALRDARDKAGLAGVAFIFGQKSQDVVEAAKAYTTYKSTWTEARTMFELTLLRDVPKEAEDYCPPFTMAQITDNEVIRLPDVKAGSPFAVQLIAVGGTGAHSWKFENPKPAWLDFTQPNSADALVDVKGYPPVAAKYTFAVTVSDGSGTTKVRNFSIEAT